MIRKNIFLFLLINFDFFALSIYSQQIKIDSLQKHLKTNPSDTSKVSTLNLLAKQFIGIGDFDQAKSIAQQAKALAEKSISPKGLANAINTIGVVEMNQGDFDKAMDNYKTALEIREKINDKQGIASSYNNIGLIYYNKGNHDKALEYYQVALKKRIEIDDKQGMALSYNNIGNLYIAESNYDKAIENQEKALKIRQGINDKAGMAMSYNNIGLIYTDKGEYQKALDHQLKSLAIKEELGDKYGMAMSYNNIGLIYYKLDNLNKALLYHSKSLDFNKQVGNKQGVAMSYNNIAIIYDRQKDFSKALENNLMSLKIRENIGDLRGAAMSYSNIGLIYSNQNDFDKALEYQLKALKIKVEIEDKIGLTISYINVASIYMKQAEHGDLLQLKPAAEYIQKSLDLSKNIGYKDGEMNAYLSFSELNDVKKDYKEAFRYHKLYSISKDSLFSDESTKQMAEMNARFETAKKDKELIQKDAEIKEQQAQTKQQELQRNTLIIGFVLAIFFSLFIFRSYKQKQKANVIITEQKNDVEKKNEIIKKQKAVVEIKNKEITDSINYAKRIQDAMLPSKKILNELFKQNFIFYQPKDIISGDFYWTTKKNNKLFIAAADCTGHGVPGALMSMIGISFLRQIINEMNVTDTAEILNKLHLMVLTALNENVNVRNSKDGMDIALLQIDLKTNKVEFSGAVRPLYLVDRNGLQIIKGDRFSIAGVKSIDESFSKSTIEAQPETALYMFSDGFADQFGGDGGKKFMIKKLQNYLLEIYNQSFEQQEKLLNKTFNDWKSDYEQVDDILVIGIKI